jgi:hypothetical protein
MHAASPAAITACTLETSQAPLSRLAVNAPDTTLTSRCTAELCGSRQDRVQELEQLCDGFSQRTAHLAPGCPAPVEVTSTAESDHPQAYACLRCAPYWCTSASASTSTCTRASSRPGDCRNHAPCHHSQQAPAAITTLRHHSSGWTASAPSPAPPLDWPTTAVLASRLQASSVV